MSDVQTWNVAAASNNSAAPNGFPEGMPPSGVNDAAREVMAAVARYRSDTDGVNTSSGTNTITLSASRTMTAYAQGDLFTFKAGGTNTDATTLNVDSLGAKDVQFNGAACVGGEIVSGLMYTVVYDGTQFQLMNAASYPAIDITTLEVTNIKAKDGAASATIANGTGVMTLASPVLTSPTLVTPTLGAASATSVANGLGAEATPSYAFTGDLDTGVWSPAANTVAVSTNAVERMRITNGGDVLVGSNAALTLSNSVSPRVQQIGTSTAGSAAGQFNFASASAGPLLAFGKARGTQSSPTLPNADDQLGLLAFEGYNDASGAWLRGASITVSFDGIASGAGVMPARMVFSTRSAAGATALERMRIDRDGNVSIGTVSDAKLSIGDTNNGLTSDTANNTLRFIDTDTTTVANQPIGKIEFYNSDTDNVGVGAYILSSAVGTSGGGTLRFGAAANAGAVAEIARVASTGLTVTAAAAGLGYGTGSGGAVTQATSRTTGVTLDKTNGAITLVSAAGSTTIQSFTVTNSTVAATDTIIVNQKSGTDLYRIYVTAVAAGSFRISFATLSGTTTEQPVFNFAVIKAVAA